jgi:hypothetical protein
VDRTQITLEAVNLLQSGPLGKLYSPVVPGRVLAVQEYETILCKYKSHLSGHYPMGKDTREILHVLRDPRWGPLAQRLAGNLEKLSS